MANPLIEVTNAMYGHYSVNNNMIDVTDSIQGLFDKQYNDNNNITNFLVSADFNSWVPPVSDPFPGQKKSLSITYILTDCGYSFSRSVEEGDGNIIISVAVPDVYYWSVINATYSSKNTGVDITWRLQQYITDPIYMSDPNYISLIVGNAKFLNLFTKGIDPDPNVRKYFTVSYVNKQGNIISSVSYDGQAMLL